MNETGNTIQRHPWLQKYPINSNSQYLIIGTHPPMPYCGKLEYYYGNMNEFWRLLQKVYSNDIIFDGINCIEEKNIQIFLEKYKISITDIVYETDGKPFSVDKDMNVVSLNTFLKKWIDESKIHTIYFTSKGYTNSAFSLFKKWYRNTYNKPLKLIKGKEDIYNYDGKEFKLINLYSPSPSARRGISGSESYKTWLKGKTHSKNLLDTYIVENYKSVLPKAIN